MSTHHLFISGMAAVALIAFGVAEASAATTNRTTSTTRSSQPQTTGQGQSSTNRPPGWNRGIKKGWDCKVGTKNCVPPGQH
jgi:hypothetical protein